MMERAVDVATGLSAVGALVVGATWIGHRLLAPTSAPAEIQFVRIEGWESYAREETRVGPALAPVTIVEFGDYQCHACALAEAHLSAVRLRYPDEVSLVYRHFPLSGHRYAEPAARAAECATEQGAFGSLHGLMFGTDEWMVADPEPAFIRLAGAAGVPDEAAYVQCLRRGGPFPGITADFAAAWRLGLSSTPTFLINGRLYVGVIDSMSLGSIVQELLDAAETSGG